MEARKRIVLELFVLFGLLQLWAVAR